MIEFTRTATAAEAYLWTRWLRRFDEPGITVGELAERIGSVTPEGLPVGVFGAGATDVDLLREVLRARPARAPFADVLAETTGDAERICAWLEFTDPGRVVAWDREQPIIGIAAYVRRKGRTIDTVGLHADCVHVHQGEWDEVREGWLLRLAGHGWQPCSIAFLTAAMTGFLEVYQRQAAPRLGQVILLEPRSGDAAICAALGELGPAGV